MRGAIVIITVCLLGVGGARAQDGQGPKDLKAQKTYLQALDLLKQGDIAGALGSFKKANKQDGGHCEACALKIIEYGLRTEDFRDADAAAQQLIASAHGPRDIALAHLQRGSVQFREGMIKGKSDYFAEADKEFQLTLAAYANVPDACFYDGCSLARLNRDDAAKAEFQRFLSIAPRDNVDRLRAQRFLVNPELARERMAPPFSATTLDGQEISLDGFAGRVVLIDFWATWCGPCREALPHIRAISQTFASQPLVVLSVSLDRDDAKWKMFVAKNQMTWLQVRDNSGDLARLFAVQSIPHTFTIDAEGVLRDEEIGDGSVEGKLKKLIARARELQEAPQMASQPAPKTSGQ